jgi:hypothetical protein
VRRRVASRARARGAIARASDVARDISTATRASRCAARDAPNPRRDDSRRRGTLRAMMRLGKRVV